MSSAPQATTTIGARTVSPRAWTPTARPATHEHAAHLHAGEHPRAGGLGARQPARGGVLLGAGRAPEGAHARGPAARRVAPQEAAAEPERLGPALDQQRVAPGQRLGHLGHADDVLDVVEELVAQRGDAVVAGPALEDARGRAKAGAGVDERRAAHGAPERQDDRRRADGRELTGVAVQAQGHVARPRGEGAVVVARALLEHDDVQAAAGELGRDRGAAGAGADHDRVGRQLGHARALRTTASGS